MKKRQSYKFIIIAIAILILAVVLFLGFKSNLNSTDYKIVQEDFVNPHSLLSEIPITELSQGEIEGLIMMREEEKLARDVYTKLGEQWGLRIFSNIASSEQTHTDSVKFLLERYNIEDSVKDNSIGTFSSSKFSGLYKSLVEKGSQSLLDALVVGATIEDLDIKDLQDLLEKTKSEDIKLVYDNLLRGSRNHIRAYTNQIKRNGGTYAPQYISQEDFNSIIASSQERGF